MNQIEFVNGAREAKAVRLCLFFTMCLFCYLMIPTSFASDVRAHGENTHGWNKPRTIAVQGSSTVNVVPDKISFLIGVEARASSVGEAYKLVEERLESVLAILEKLEIPQQGIQAMHLSLQPVIDYKQNQRIVGHDARRDVRVTLSDLERYAQVIDRLSAIDAIRFQQVQLLSSQMELLQQEALEAAYLVACKKAEGLAKIGGYKLGPLLQLDETGAGSQPRFRVDTLRMAESSQAAISPGVISVGASLTAIFLLDN